MPRVYLKRTSKRRFLRKKKPVKKVRVVVKEMETKYKAVKAAFSDLEAAAQRIIHLSPIAQGAYPEDRTGQFINPTRLIGRVAVKTTGNNPPCWVRMMIIKAKQCDGTAPTLADILPDSSSDLTFLPVDLPYQDATDYGYGLAQSKRKFQVLYDRCISLYGASNDGSKLTHIFKVNKKLSGKIYYTDRLATDEGNNQLYLFVHTDAGNDLVECAHDFRLFFKDG